MNDLNQKVTDRYIRGFVLLSVVVVALQMFFAEPKPPTLAPQVALSPLEQLAKAQPSALTPNGELAEIVKLGSDYADLRRQQKLKEIHGRIVEWRLPVYAVVQSGKEYIIQTSGRPGGHLKLPHPWPGQTPPGGQDNWYC